MKLVVIVVCVTIVLIPAYFFLLGFMSRSGAAAGLDSGRLSICPEKPNCVCSEYDSVTRSFIAPVELPEERIAEAWDILKDPIGEQGGQFQSDDGDYIAATFSSAVFGFVDDLEIRLDRANNRIHFRSASRVGHSDLSANRKRVELLIQQLKTSLQ